ncbi:MAG: DUF285 domain-containing protein [Lachnospiraceae bacterium]|nr:DUF285 domain-containing protein [Lachnospiraceae bacterium]
MKRVQNTIFLFALGIFLILVLPFTVHAEDNGARITKAPNLNFGKCSIDIKKDIKDKSFTLKRNLLDTAQSDASIIIDSKSDRSFKVNLSFDSLKTKEGLLLDNYVITLKGMSVTTFDEEGMAVNTPITAKKDYTFIPGVTKEILATGEAGRKGTTTIDFDSVVITFNKLSTKNINQTYKMDINVMVDDGEAADTPQVVVPEPDPYDGRSGLLIQWTRKYSDTPYFDYLTNEEAIAASVGYDNSWGIRADNISCKQGVVDSQGNFTPDTEAPSGDYSQGINLETRNNAVFMAMDNLTSLDHAFDHYSSDHGNTEQLLGEIKISTIGTTPALKSTTNMFTGNFALEMREQDESGLDLSDFDTTGVTDMSGMFENTPWLHSLNVSGFDTSSVTNMSHMFDMCAFLNTLDLSSFNTSNVIDMSYMFSSTGNFGDMENLNISTFDTSNVTNMEKMFYGIPVTSLDVSGFNTARVTNMTSMFDGCGFITSLVVSDFNTSQVTDMSGMFDGCQGLTSLDLSNFNTARVTNMSTMFSSCKALTSLNLSSFNTEQVTNMSEMFSNCIGLTSLNLSSFNTAHVIDMSSMFNKCSGFTSLDLSSFDTSYVANMSGMFSSCKGFASLDLSNFNTIHVTDMSNMFSSCINLISLNLENFSTRSDTNVDYMFSQTDTAKENITTNLDNWAVKPPKLAA